jgi:hypothetical protein
VIADRTAFVDCRRFVSAYGFADRAGICQEARKLIDLPKDWKRWATADREPIAQWTFRRATLLSDAAHPMLQSLAQGACMAMEDAVTLGEALRVHDNDFARAFALYQRLRVARTARVVLSAREMGRISPCGRTFPQRPGRAALVLSRGATAAALVHRRDAHQCHSSSRASLLVVLALRGGAFSLDTQAAVLFVLAGQRQVEAAAQQCETRGRALVHVSISSRRQAIVLPTRWTGAGNLSCATIL